MREIDKPGRAQRQWFKQPVLTKPVQGMTADQLHRFRQYHKPEVAIEALHSWLAQRFFPVNHLQNMGFSRAARDKIDSPRSFALDDLLAIRLPRWQSRRMTQQLAKRRQVFAKHSEHGNDPCEFVIQSNLFLVD